MISRVNIGEGAYKTHTWIESPPGMGSVDLGTGWLECQVCKITIYVSNDYRLIHITRTSRLYGRNNPVLVCSEEMIRELLES